jgi:hypothetical protein
MGNIRQSVIASISFPVTPVSSTLKMVIEGKKDSKVEWKSRRENVVLVLMELSHGLVLGTDWIDKIAGTSVYPLESAERVIPDSILNPSKTLSAVQSRLLISEMEIIKNSQWPTPSDNEGEKLLTRFGNLFHGNSYHESTTVAECHINIKEQQPIRPFRVSHSERENIRNQVEEILGAGVIESSKIPWSSAVVTVPKVNNSRMRIVNRHLNDHDVNPLQGIDDFLNFENPERGGLGVIRANG